MMRLLLAWFLDHFGFLLAWIVMMALFKALIWVASL